MNPVDGTLWEVYGLHPSSSTKKTCFLTLACKGTSKCRQRRLKKSRRWGISPRKKTKQDQGFDDPTTCSPAKFNSPTKNVRYKNMVEKEMNQHRKPDQKRVLTAKTTAKIDLQNHSNRLHWNGRIALPVVELWPLSLEPAIFGRRSRHEELTSALGVLDVYIYICTYGCDRMCMYIIYIAFEISSCICLYTK